MTAPRVDVRRGETVCPVCHREAPTHRSDAFVWLISRHNWFMTEGRCPGSLRLVPAATP